MPPPPALSQPLTIGPLSLKNRITMAPLYLGYANPDGTVNQVVLDHYREMAASGAAMIVVENVSIDPSGLGSPWTMRIDNESFLEGLQELARVIKAEGAIACLQVNHAGRYAFMPDKMSPSGDPNNPDSRGMTAEEIRQTIESYARSAALVKTAGFDAVEIHGGTGYLIVQFLSSRTNQRNDQYGGSLENRRRFGLEVVDAVKKAVGPDYPVGYRFLAEELVPDGLKLKETIPYAQELVAKGISYLSVMAGCYDAFVFPEYIEMERQEGYMVSQAETIKKACPDTPVITAGRIQTPEFASTVIQEGRADMVGLARVLFADPLWPRKALGEIDDPIVTCEPTCSLCMKRIMSGKPAICSQWAKARRQAFLESVGEDPQQEVDNG
jgi:2,4-dienoyl-CoA reductase-like NADH-dependent reductase (Old Yellow Enzyme family)